MSQIHFIKRGKNLNGDPVVLWHKGNYTYEIEIGNDYPKRKISLNDTSYEIALSKFNTERKTK